MGGVLAVAMLLSGCGEHPLSGDAGPAPDAVPFGVPGEVRGVRLIPGEDSVTVDFFEAPDALWYTACFSTEPEPITGACVEGVTPPFTMEGLDSGVRLWWVVVAHNEHGRGPFVETPSVVPGPATRPLAIHATMTPQHLEQLYSRSVWSDVLLPAEVALGDAAGPVAAVPDVVGLRFRGHNARGQDRKSYNIRLAERPEVGAFPDFNFRGPDRAAGNRVLLNQTWTDPSGIRPALAFAMYQELGLPAPTTFFADWWLNGTYEGHYVGVERIDREALRRWGLNRRSGGFTLVRDQARFNRHRPEIDTISMFAIDPETLGASDTERLALLREVYDYRGEVDDHNWEELLALLRWVHQTGPGPAWRAGLSARFDVDSLIDVLAVHSLQYDFDSFADDYWLYRDDDGDGLWRVIPWDKDLTFGRRWYAGFGTVSDFFYFHGDFDSHIDNPLIDRTVESYKDRLDQRVRELSEERFTDAWFTSTVDALAAQVEASQLRWPAPAFQAHPRQHFTDPGWFAWHLEALQDFPVLRRAWLLADRFEGEPYLFDGVVALGSDGTGWVTDADGWVLARFDGAAGAVLDLRVELRDTPGADGVRKEWRLDNRGAPWAGRLTLYYRNRPGETWLPNLEAAGRSWELTVVDSRAGWLPTRVNPFSNTVSAHVTLNGSHRVQVLFRR